MLLSMTILAAHPIFFSGVISLPAALIVIMRPSKLSRNDLLPTPTSHSGHPLSPRASRPTTPTRTSSFNSLSQHYNTDSHPLTPSNKDPQLGGFGQERLQHSGLSRVPYLTIYRSHMLLMTVLAILAVDFPVFPRYLAKCESFGVSMVCSPLFCTRYQAQSS